MSDRTFGRLELVDPTDYWPGGREDFVSWLAEADNLDLLCRALGLDLEVEAVDRVIGPLSADMVCRDTYNDSRVLIEAQLDATDNAHLGRLIAYAAGLEARRVIWVAGTFREEERAALDWLNRKSTLQLSFYGVELQVLRVDGSAAAPAFQLVTRPNDWSRRARNGVRAIETEELTESRRLQQDYWSALLSTLRERGGPIQSAGKASPRAWAGFRLGHPGVRLAAVLQRKEQQIAAEIALTGEDAQLNFRRLGEERDAIEAQIGYGLEWQPADERGTCRISVVSRAAALADRTDWARQHAWLAERLEDLYRAFAGRVRTLDEEEEDEEGDAANGGDRAAAE